MAIIRALFYKLPKPGDVYVDDTDNPFDRRRWRVVDAKEGWVKYTSTSWQGCELTCPRWLFHLDCVKEK